MGTKLIRGAILATATAGVALAAAGVAQAGGAPDGWVPGPSVEPGYIAPIVDPACIPVQPGVSIPHPADVPCFTPEGFSGVMPSR
ncbi:hypothetical protein M1M07_09045 [Rhodococcus sp. HM1]|uniref:hypothetical protein n=1 Tax=unclassified Rhodococcus (in: high G+C Gram-positive bacteria) TaxID=192944 RepID=UPI0018CD401D|nr:MULTISPECIES: hypothetical protein [unclassified Rhodococcus (in: high G+C Gram-positive bacteria)]MBH0121252.1 hypothetical protein [Rhodococcus sp. CX]MCK8671265.1 hypothetical protein [Rhodococcus sp. HM1]